MITTGELQKKIERTRQQFETAVRDGDEEGTHDSEVRNTLLLDLLDLSKANDQKLNQYLTELQDKARKGEPTRVIPRTEAYLLVLEAWRDFSID